MRISAGLFAAAIFGSASQAHASLSGFCVGIDKNSRAYVTPVIDLPPTSTDDRVSTGDRYQEWLQDNVEPTINYGKCPGYESRAEAETEHASVLQHMYSSG